MLLLKCCMRGVFIAAILLALAASAYSQDESQQFGNNIKREDVLALPRRDRAPQISLRRALKIAERFARTEHLNLSGCYLFEARLLMDETNPETQAWHFWWIRVNSNVGNDVRIVVSMNGKARRLRPT
jgi:hypothetical protein